jgi:hypothetical protein
MPPPPQTRITRHPPIAPPTLDCPQCRKSLIYHQSFLSGVKQIEQWDRYGCVCCRGIYEYRQRTGMLRRMEGCIGRDGIRVSQPFSR